MLIRQKTLTERTPVYKRIFATGLIFAILLSFTACDPIGPIVPRDEKGRLGYYLTASIPPAYREKGMTVRVDKSSSGTFSADIFLKVDNADMRDVKLDAGNLYHKIMAVDEYNLSDLSFTLFSGGKLVGSIYNRSGDEFVLTVYTRNSDDNLLTEDADTELFTVPSSEKDDSVQSGDSDPASANPLTAAELNVQTPSIEPQLAEGIKYAYITVTKADLISVTQEQFAEFVSACVDGSGYNWVSIICEDGTGICFTGSSKDYASYGPVDALGRVTTSDEMIMRKGDGTYRYVTDKK